MRKGKQPLLFSRGLHTLFGVGSVNRPTRKRRSPSLLVVECSLEMGKRFFFSRFSPVLFFLVLCVVSTAFSVRAEMLFSTPAREAVMVDVHTGATLFAKNENVRMPPASMSKIMTLLLVFEYLRDDLLHLDDMFVISPNAASKGGSRMFLVAGSEVSVADLVRGVIVQSGNDAAIALAEGIAGTEEVFVQMLNRRAGEMGLTNSHFANATGWPDRQHYMSARDLATLSAHVIVAHADLYTWFAEQSFQWSNILQYNRNPLLGESFDDIQVDGLKTGYTKDARYGLTASGIREGRRLLLVVNGLSSLQARAAESRRLLILGFRNFVNKNLFSMQDEVVRLPVWLGEEDSVVAFPSRPVVVTVPRREQDRLAYEVTYTGPLEAPIPEGAEIGRLQVLLYDQVLATVPLVAGRSVERDGIFGRFVSRLWFLILGANSFAST